jgi:mRNA interferase RelE/StbE
VYTLSIRGSAASALRKLPQPLRERLLRAAYRLEQDPRPRPASKKLAGPHDLYRIRVGDYRVVYRIDDQKQSVEITIVAHRREVYRDL